MQSFDRRDFLKSSAAALAASSIAGAAKAGPNDVVRIGVIGARGRGMEHLDQFWNLPNSEVVAICDIDPMVLGIQGARHKSKTKKDAKLFKDMRELFDDKEIDAVSIATPNHWHTLAAMWAMQAGKDVYVEKPCSHNVSEGRKLVECARKEKKICQHGTQARSSAACQAAVQFIKEGGIGKVHTARGLCYKWRPSIGTFPDSTPPKGVDYSMWLGPAPERPYNQNRFHYNWHWHWDYGNGDIGNQGVHQMDVARWGLGKDTLPTKVASTGGRYGYEDQGETPNTQVSTFDYGDCLLTFEVRGLPTNDELGVKVGNIFYGSEGYLVMPGYGEWTVFRGANDKKGETADSYMKTHPQERAANPFANFLAAVQARDSAILNAEVLEGHLSSSLGHLANIAYRLGRTLEFDPKTETFGSDEEANRYLTREYRSPFTLPNV